MINPLSNAVLPVPAAGSQSSGAQQKVLTMVTNDRMAGSIPRWVRADSQRQQIERDLSLAQTGATQQESSLSLGYNGPVTTAQSEEPFGFGDLLDMINPLQHVPVVGHIYRSMTGDDIKPIGRIIGGALFGGAAGAAGSLVSVVVEQETGRDIAGNAIALVTRSEAPTFKSAAAMPETTLENAQRVAENYYGDLPASLLAFTAPPRYSDITIEKFASTDLEAKHKRSGEFSPYGIY
jgi:hypothetical protein